jgi:hypothetical protein
VCALGVPSVARAELPEDAARLVRALGVQGIAAAALEPLYAFRGEPSARSLPARTAKSPRCRSVIGLADRQIRFAMGWGAGDTAAGAADASPLGGFGGDAATVESSLGVAVLHDCDREGDRDSVHVAMIAPRAAVELVVAWHDGPLAPLGVLLPERRLAPAAASDGSTASAPPTELKARVASAEGQARLEGATMAVRVPFQAEARGHGAIRLRLPQGCHRIHVVAERAEPSAAPHDVDAELARAADGTLLAQDRSVAPDARLESCLAESGALDLRFVGAPARAPIVVLDAIWPLPVPEPSGWDATTRAAIGWGLWQSGAPALAPPTVVELVGAQGTTVVALALDAGRCYVGALGVTGGQASALRLAVTAGGSTVTDVASSPPFGAAVGFCLPDHPGKVTAQVELRASLAWWRLGIWRVAGATP